MNEFKDDILHGAKAIGEFIGVEERRAYYLLEKGYLPGTKDEKLASWMQPVSDNLQFLVDPNLEQTGDKVQYLYDTGVVEAEAVTYIRGRSLPKLFIGHLRATFKCKSVCVS